MLFDCVKKVGQIVGATEQETSRSVRNMMRYFSGYSADAAVQSSRTVFFLDLEYILIPGFLMAAAAVVLHFLPINKQRFESLKKAIALREEGGDYSMYMDDVKKILG